MRLNYPVSGSIGEGGDQFFTDWEETFDSFDQVQRARRFCPLTASTTQEAHLFSHHEKVLKY